MHVKISGMEFGRNKFSAIVMAESLEQVQDNLAEVMLVTAGSQIEFEDAISDLGFEIENKECDPDGETFVIIVDKEPSGF